jgi:adenylate cyclase class 2
MAQEVEIKIRVDDAEEAVARIEGLGAPLVRERHFEDNYLFDLEGDPLLRQGKLLRVRVVDGRGVVTVKTPAPKVVGSRFKVRREIETEVADADALVEALVAVGFASRWRYQKYRRVWRLGESRIFLDEIPWGAWLEIEGDPDGIDEIAGCLGYGADRRTRDTYRGIHERQCAERAIPVGDMVFEAGVPE